MKFKRTVIYTDEVSLFTPAQFLEEVNSERSEDWTPYDMDDVVNNAQEIIDHCMNNDHETWETIQWHE
jgi:hypothetical protein